MKIVHICVEVVPRGGIRVYMQFVYVSSGRIVRFGIRIIIIAPCCVCCCLSLLRHCSPLLSSYLARVQDKKKHQSKQRGGVPAVETPYRARSHTKRGVCEPSGNDIPGDQRNAREEREKRKPRATQRAGYR